MINHIMELGEALKYFFVKAKIIINYGNININLLSYFPLLKKGYGLLDTIRNIFILYIKINKLKKENKIIVDELFIEAFNGLIPISNYKFVTNKYCYLIYLYEYIIKYEKFDHINLLIGINDFLDPMNCPIPLKFQYNNLINTITEYHLLKIKDFLSVKEIFIKNYKEYNIETNTFNFLECFYENFNNKILDFCNIKDIIDLNIVTKESNTSENLEKELYLSHELVKILKSIEQDNVFEAAIVRNNNTHVKIIEHNFDELILILKNANYTNCNHVLNNIFNDNYFKLLNAIICNDCQEVYKYLYELKIDPRGNENNLYYLSNSKKIKEMISDVSIKKNLLQKTVINNKIDEIIGFGYGDLSNSINEYILNLI